MAQRPRVVIVGAGFGGLAAARALRRAPVDAVLVDRHNYHLFQPLLYQVASGLLDPSQISAPVRTVLRRARNVDVRMAEVTGIDLQQRVVTTASGELPYDYLLFAPGSSTNFYGIPHLEESATGLKNLSEAIGLRNRVLSRFERATLTDDPADRRRLLSFAVVGAGPTGVEYSGALAELVKHVLPKDFPRLDFSEVSITLLEGSDRILGSFAVRLGSKAAANLERKGVRIVLGRSVRDYREGSLRLDNDDVLPAGTVVWTAGVSAAPATALLGGATGRQGRVAVTPSLHLPAHPEVFVIGDAALTAGDEPLPMLAPVAIQQGKHVAHEIAARIRGGAERPFRYRDKGTMATVGRGAAVAEIGPIRINGLIGWLIWIFVHLLYLVGFRNRAVALFTWAWNYFFYDRPVRLIIDPPSAGRSMEAG